MTKTGGIQIQNAVFIFLLNHFFRPLVNFQILKKEAYSNNQSSQFGKCLLNDILHLIKKHPVGLCEFCHYPETVPHYLLECIDLQEKWLVLSNAHVERESLMYHIHSIFLTSGIKKNAYSNPTPDYL